jgi:hypothetical protein
VSGYARPDGMALAPDLARDVDALIDDETIRAIDLDFSERETLRWAQAGAGTPTAAAKFVLESMGLIEPDPMSWSRSHRTTASGEAKLAMIGWRG